MNTSIPIFETRFKALCLSPSRVPNGAGYHVLAEITLPARNPASDAADGTRVPSRLRAMNGELTAWRRRLANPEHSHRVNDGS